MEDDPFGKAWREHPSVRELMAVLDAAGGCARFVGGCVRNTLLERPIVDIDVATTHHPQETMRRLRAAGHKAIPTGVSHGTITAVVDGRTFEVTTLRLDVETDGRRAVVAFTDDWAIDAARRDFTMNAMFMDLCGTLYDPVGGKVDAAARLVRFIGDPYARIDEDALRILRFFRLLAHYGRLPPDPDSLAACRAMAGRLTALSGERIRDELLRLLSAPGAGPVVAAMRDAGILQPLFPGRVGVDALCRLIAIDGDDVDSLRRLAVLLPAAADDLSRRLRLSRAQRERLTFMTTDRLPTDASDRTLRAVFYRLGQARFRDAAYISAVLSPDDAGGHYRGLAIAASWDPPAFPLRGADLRELGLCQGQCIGALLKQLEAHWVEQDFNGDHDQCLDWARALVAVSDERQTT